MKKSFKYILIVSVISLFNYLLWLISKSECLAQKVDKEFEFDVIFRNIFLSIVSLICLLLLSLIIRKIKKFEITFRNKMILSIVVTLIVFWGSTSTYSWRILAGQILKSDLRMSLCDKISTDKLLASGFTGENLSLEEYNVLRGETWFPKIPQDAKEISFGYGFDGFLPDYYFSLEYKVDRGIFIEEINEDSGDWSKSQNYEIKGDKKLVTYTEMNR